MSEVRDWCFMHGVHSDLPGCPTCAALQQTGFPAGMVGYCRIGHPEIYSRDIVCPLCAHIAASAEKHAALEEN